MVVSGSVVVDVVSISIILCRAAGLVVGSVSIIAGNACGLVVAG